MFYKPKFYKPRFSGYNTFGLIRLLLLAILIFAFVVYTSQTPEPAEPDPAPEATTAPETTASTLPHKETTPETKVATMATEPPTEPTTEPTTVPTEETEPPVYADTFEYTEKELEYLALVVYQEAGANRCSDETRLMVANVVVNRLFDDRFPDTMKDVILQRGQYGRLHWTGPTWPSRAWDRRERAAVDRAYDIAERILQGERVLPADVVYQSEYIQGEIVAHSDDFFFCR